MIDLKNIPFTRKKALIRESCLMYKLIKNRINQIEAVAESNDIVMKPIHIKVALQEHKRASTFEMLFGLLEKEEQTLISNDFLLVSDYDWWRKTYSKSTYYKLKHQAIDKFVGLLYS